MLSLTLTLAGPGGVAGAAPSGVPVPSPTVDGPILPSSGISFLGSTLFSPSTVGYEESEFFLSGTATSYTDTSPLTNNGQVEREDRHHRPLQDPGGRLPAVRPQGSTARWWWSG